MKLKFTLTSSGRKPVDLVATADAAGTIGDLARNLARSDPTAPGARDTSEQELTLARVGPETMALDPRATIAESGIHSGDTVTLTRTGQTFDAPNVGTVAIVTVLEGPDKSREYPIPTGTSIIGREQGCEVLLSDPLVSRQHARLNVSDVVEIIDLGSANGIMIGDAVMSRATLRDGDSVRIGDSMLSVHLLRRGGPSSKADAAVLGFVRSPRLDPRYEGETFTAPGPPERPDRQHFPIIPLLAPLLLGALLYAMTRSATALIFVALSPLMIVGNAVESRIGGRARFKKEVSSWRAELEDLSADAQDALDHEIEARNQEHPPIAVCLDAAQHATPLLWARRPGEPGFVELKLGSGRQPSRTIIKLPESSKAPRELLKELEDATAPFESVASVPVIARPAEQGAIGIAGARASRLGAARALLAQLAILHSPADLVIAGVASSQSARDWDWIKWLPHSSSPHSPLTVPHLASTATAGTKLVSELDELVANRDAEDAPAGPVIVLLVEDDAPIEHNRLVELAERAWEHGIYVVWMAAEVGHLPAACRTYLDLGSVPGEASIGFVQLGEEVTPVAVEGLEAAEALLLARRMSPMVDIGARVDDESDLPRSVSLLSLTGAQLASSQEAVIERWTENRSIVSGPMAPEEVAGHAGTLRAVVGQAAGEPLALDLRADGPHALVGGTTGSGKSELLQAWILAMAAAHSPQRLTFLLVDYKGGSAFSDCVKLPHTVGLVTDLSPHLVRRALTSLSAELRYREHILSTHAAKDLVSLEKQGVVDAPPSLVIVVDEFAALVSEVPEFVDGVVDVAQRGRSLGLHLILATQRPAGVIKDNLRANTNLRLALRMADEADSTDVLGSPIAAFFDQAIPGRVVSKTGPSRLVPFQAAYAGGWTTDEPPPPEIQVEELVFGVGARWEPPAVAESIAGDRGDTDIKRIVRSVRAASTSAEMAAPRKPWLPELRPVYELADQTSVPTRRRDTELVYGIQDDPEHQAQPTVAFHPDLDGNLAVYGTGGSGKSTLLRTLAIAAGFTVRGGPCHVYGIDFGAQGLRVLEELPHVGSIIAGADHERITRLLRWLRNLVDERALRYSRANAATITDFRRLAEAPDEPRILLLVDGIAAFRQAYEATDRVRWFETFASLASDGRPVGVHVLISSDQRGALTTTLASAVQSRVVLRLASEDDYGMLGVPSDVLSAQTPPGRGLLGDSEIQVAVLGGTADAVDQAVAIKGFADSMRRAGVTPAPPIESLPERVTLSALPSSLDGLPVIGLSSSTLRPTTFQPRGAFIVSGPPASGRTTTLHTLAEGLVRWNARTRLYYFGNRRSSLTTLPFWARLACGAADVDEAATALASELALGTASGDPTAIFVENISDFLGGPAEGPLQELVKVCLAEEHFLVAEGESSTLSSSYGLLGHVKSSRAGIALAPDQADGTTIYRTNFPRTNRADFPAGRGLLVSGGTTEVVQVASP